MCISHKPSICITKVVSSTMIAKDYSAPTASIIAFRPESMLAASIEDGTVSETPLKGFAGSNDREICDEDWND